MDANEQQLPAEPELVATPAEVIERRPRRIHYSIWGICFLLDFVIHVIPWYSQLLPMLAVSERWSHLVNMLINSIGGSMICFGPFLFVERRAKKIPFPRAPGDFLLLALSARLLFSTVIEIVLYYTTSVESRIETYTQYLWLITNGSVFLAALVMLLAWPRASQPWRVGIVCIAGLSLWASVGAQLGMIRYQGIAFHIVRLLPIVILIWVCAADMRQRHRYSWTHWLGIGLQVFILVTPLMQAGISRLMSYLQLRGRF